MLINNNNFFVLVVLLLFSILLLSSCTEPALDNYNDVSYELENQDGESVTFPDDFKGNPLILGFIYTNCPDICSFITANVKKIHDEIDDPADTQFVLITFDPARDTPEVLREYAAAFDMNRAPFHFLTGDEQVINDLMIRFGVRTQESYSKDLENGERLYFINHSDKILLINEQLELIFDYGGSMTPPSIIIEDLEKL